MTGSPPPSAPLNRPGPDRLRARAYDGQAAASLLTDAQALIVYANPAYERLTGYELRDLVGRDYRILQGPDTDPATIDAISRARTSAREFRGEILSYRADGSTFWNLLTVTPLRDKEDRLMGFVSAQLDITAEVRERRARDEGRETADLLLAVASRLSISARSGTTAEAVAQAVVSLGMERSAVFLLDEDRASLHVAAQAGWPPELREEVAEFRNLTIRPEFAEMLADPRPILVNGSTGSDWVKEQCERFQISGFVMIPIWAEADASTPQGLLVAYWGSDPPPPTLPRLLQERLSGIAGLAAVAFQGMELIDQARHAAERDPLTGLATRVRVHRHLMDALAEPDAAAGVIYGDIDRFKRVNDSLGHASGDRVLAQVAARMELAMDGLGTLGRPGGDEFIVVLPGVRTRDQVTAVVDQLEETMRGPFDIDGRAVYITLSYGSASGRRKHEPLGEAAETLIRAADADMYRSKHRRSVVPEQYGDTDPLRLDSDLHRAVQTNAITAHFQAQFDAQDGRITGYEALARWEHPELGMIRPSLFIPIAENNGLIRTLGVQMFAQACRFAETAIDQDTIRIQVNVSTRELSDPDYARDVLAILDRYPGRRWQLGLEVTESALILDRELVGTQLRLLEGHGVIIAIDDFGTGYSSLAHLQDLPARELKIDSSFVQREGALASSLLRAIIDLAHSLQLEVIGEGVETVQQLTTLRDLGCDRIQGYLLARPLPAGLALMLPAHAPIDTRLQTRSSH